ncbi:MAG TPA: glycoside hydrolase family 99-like domain-containing protein [Rhodanobacteraceae bacterium]|nr:glycoside hydrolase family 99-like domain-containing protein [Rhodanobacteraceae bacterium]
MQERIRSRARTWLFHGLRLAFRLAPLPQATRDRWRQRFLDRHPELIPDGPRGQVIGDAAMRRHAAREQAGQPAIGYVPWRAGALPDPLPATLVAFYLPQFHPIPENDAWWGPGFTEWHNVTRALPQFAGHAQPRLPGALGFYDLRIADAMRKQMQLAREYGIAAFCFYQYWFAGTRLLDAPLEQWLADPSLDLPVCLCWANESWTRRWDGRADAILIAQQHSADDDLAFIADVARYLADPRYLRVDGKPLLLVYRTGLLPDARATAQRWRAWCREHGIGEIFLAGVQGFEQADPRGIGFDAAVEFPPNLATPKPITARQRLLNPEFAGQVLDWREVAREVAARPMPPWPLFPGVNPGWDNEPRRAGRGRVYAHASPRGYRDWLQRTLETRVTALPPSQRLVFVNAWNEWAEGAVLEPDARLGHAWLDATRQALVRAAPGDGAAASRDPRPCAIVHAWYVEVLDEIVVALRASGVDWRLIVTTTHDRAGAVRARLDALAMPAEVEVAENRGRDILPFLRVANRLLDEGVGIAVKLHTKQSTHRHDGERWRRELLERLLAPGRAAVVARAFAADDALGLVAAEGHIQPLDYYWGANRDNVGYLATRIGMAPPKPDRDAFVAGSMFWARLEALRPLLDAHLDPWEFEDEAGQVDGTFAHAVERVIALACVAAGYRLTTAAALCGEPEPGGTYPYAVRG